jgi:hypothetical protein
MGKRQVTGKLSQRTDDRVRTEDRSLAGSKSDVDTKAGELTTVIAQRLSKGQSALLPPLRVVGRPVLHLLLPDTRRASLPGKAGVIWQVVFCALFAWPEPANPPSVASEMVPSPKARPKTMLPRSICRWRGL